MTYDYDIPVRRTVTFPRWKCALAAMFGQREIETETCVLDGYHVRLFTEFYYLSGMKETVTTLRTHWAKDPVTSLVAVEQDPTETFKPKGLWYSVDGDWERWCEGEQLKASMNLVIRNISLEVQWATK